MSFEQSMSLSMQNTTDDCAIAEMCSASSQKEEYYKNMSFGCILSAYNEIYIASDSRSTIYHPDNSVTLSDNYKKIVVVPDTNIVVLSTGLNSFDEFTLEDIVSQLQNKKMENIYQELKNKFAVYERKYNQKVLFNLAGNDVEDDTLRIRTSNDFISDFYRLQALGANQMTAFISQFTSEMIKNNLKRMTPEQFLNKIMDIAKETSDLFNNSIGGATKILKITKNKMEWVQ